MPVVRWILNSAATALRAGQLIQAGKSLVHGALEEALVGETDQVHAACRAANIATQRVWDAALLAVIELGGTTAGLVGPLQQSLGGVHGLERVAQSLQTLESRLRATHPDIDAQLQLRQRPLREQWDALGPGLMKRIGGRSLPDARAADVLLVLPLLGGGGALLPNRSGVHIEAVLANPNPELPEFVRLGWLLTQLQATCGDDYLAAVAAIPRVLQAAEVTGHTSLSTASVAAAHEWWLGFRLPDGAAAAVLTWWQANETQTEHEAVASLAACFAPFSRP